ncbi:MAG TPA: hypothetical protein VGL56_16540 [Fimbriimonadaceae bacterium]|jgi:hypothetical protein
MSHKTAICYVAHDDHYFFDASIRSFHCGLPTFLFLSTTPWHGAPGDFQETERIAKSHGVTVISGDWPGEEIHRNAAYDWLKENGFEYVLVPDTDEIIEPQLLNILLNIAQNSLADRVHIEWDTYWRSHEYVIRPREKFTPIILANLNNATYNRVREWSGGRPLLLNETYGIIHHMSYAGTDARILRKITS